MDSESDSDSEDDGIIYSEADLWTPEGYEALTQQLSPPKPSKPTSKPSISQGKLTVLRSESHKTDVCYLLSLPLGLFRDLVTYISSDDFVSLALTCTKFAKLLTDRYIGYQGINFYGELEEKDIENAVKLQDLARGFKFVRTFASVLPEIEKMFYVDPVKKTFFSLSSSSILEGKFHNGPEIISERLCIPHVSVTCVWQDCIVCASDSVLALSAPMCPLVTTSIENGTNRDVKFVGNGEFIALLRDLKLEIYTRELKLIGKLASKGTFLQVYVPKPEKPVFVTISEYFDFTTFSSFNQINGYQIKNDAIHSLFQQNHLSTHFTSSRTALFTVSRRVKEIHMQRITDTNQGTLDLLTLLFEDGVVIVNGDHFETEVISLKTKNELLIALKGRYVSIYQANMTEKRYILVQNYAYHSQNQAVPVSVELWRSKALIVTSNSIEWCRKQKNELLCVSRTHFSREIKIKSVQLFGDFVVIKGNVTANVEINSKVYKFSAAENVSKKINLGVVIVANFGEFGYSGEIEMKDQIESEVMKKLAEDWPERKHYRREISIT